MRECAVDERRRTGVSRQAADRVGKRLMRAGAFLGDSPWLRAGSSLIGASCRGFQDRVHAGKEPGADRDAFAIAFEEPAPRVIEPCAVEFMGEHAREHRPGAARHQGPQPGLVHRAGAGLAGHRIEGAGQIGEGVGQRAVEIEEHRFEPPRRLRRVSLHPPRTPRDS